MNNALIDDRRIKVDFSQSVAKLYNKYAQKRRQPSYNRGNKRLMQTDSTHRSKAPRQVERYPSQPRQIYALQQSQNDQSSVRRRDRGEFLDYSRDHVGYRKDMGVSDRSDSESLEIESKDRNWEKDKRHSRHRHKSRSRHERDEGSSRHHESDYDRRDRKRNRRDRHRKKHRKRKLRSRSRSRSRGRK